MITPESSEAKDLIDLAERMGIPTTDAVQRVVKHISDREGHEAPSFAVAHSAAAD